MLLFQREERELKPAEVLPEEDTEEDVEEEEATLEEEEADLLEETQLIRRHRRHQAPSQASQPQLQAFSQASQPQRQPQMSLQLRQSLTRMLRLQ